MLNVTIPEHGIGDIHLDVLLNKSGLCRWLNWSIIREFLICRKATLFALDYDLVLCTRVVTRLLQ